MSLEMHLCKMKLSELPIIIWLIVACNAQIKEQCTKDGQDCVGSSKIRGGSAHFKDMKLDEAAACLPDIRAMIFPGTKWCGPGNIAHDGDDLGVFHNTDKCCRAHDNCNDKIHSAEKKYNLTNTGPMTRVTCKCDTTFNKCLLDVDSIISVTIGVIYFNIFGNICFQKTYPAKCDKYSYVPKKKCVKYLYDKSKPKLYQWFDSPHFMS